jgi:hypothetical protein
MKIRVCCCTATLLAVAAGGLETPSGLLADRGCVDASRQAGPPANQRNK